MESHFTGENAVNVPPLLPSPSLLSLSFSSSSPAALNYGLFRQSSFNSTPQYIMFYDMGAGSTTATIIGIANACQEHTLRSV